MTAALDEHAKTVYQTRYAEPDTEACFTNAQAKTYYKGFIGAHNSTWHTDANRPFSSISSFVHFVLERVEPDFV